MRASLFIALLLMLQSGLVYADAEIHFSGKLVEEPCLLDPEDRAIEIDFGTVINKFLYSYQRTPGKKFILHLLECDLNLGETVMVTFMGTEDINQPGLIALDISSTAGGVAIGIETSENALIPINKPSPMYQLEPDKNEINIQAFISATNEAKQKKTIIPGIIKSTAIFRLEYE